MNFIERLVEYINPGTFVEFVDTIDTQHLLTEQKIAKIKAINNVVDILAYIIKSGYSIDEITNILIEYEMEGWVKLGVVSDKTKEQVMRSIVENKYK